MLGFISRPPVAIRTGLINPSDIQTAVSAIDAPPLVKHHPWNMKYLQIHTRENSKKTMTKDSYTQKAQLLVRAKESIATEEECQPELISPDDIRIRQVIIHGENKNPCKFTFDGKIRKIIDVLAPNIVRYLRSNVSISSEQLLPSISSKKSSLGSKTLFPIIGTHLNTPPAPTITTRNVLLSQIKLRHNNSTDLHRAPRRILMETIHETITPLSVYG